MSKHQEHTHHITPISKLFGTFVALTILMLLTVGSSYIQFDNPMWNNGINLGIAVIKATLVVRIFMGYAYTTSLGKIFALAGFVWLTLMGITFGDYFTRQWEYTPGWYAKDKNGAPPLLNQSRNPYSRAESNTVEVAGAGQPPELTHEAKP